MKRLLLIPIVLLFLSCSASFLDPNSCDRIKKKVSKFDNSIIYSTPILDVISFSKYVNSNLDGTYLSVQLSESYLTTGGKGLTLLLENGEKITWDDEDIDVDVGYSSRWTYSAFTRLNFNQIKLLRTYKVTDVKLYIFEKKIRNPERYKSFLKCLTDDLPYDDLPYLPY
tara:strand:- start:838 stop:1344 length:507 start_codon:yes stop_codon:yes gene_type:complete